MNEPTLTDAERLLGEWQRGEIPVDVVLSRLAHDRRVRTGEPVCTDPRPLVAATIESLLWAIEEDQRQEFAQTAQDVRAMEQDYPCCALCDEVDCDDNCPLADWREGNRGIVGSVGLRDHVAARVAEAVDRERAAWATKVYVALARHEVGAFAGSDTACTCDRTWRSNAAHRAHVTAVLLAADDTDHECAYDTPGAGACGTCLASVDDTEEIHPSVQWVANIIAAAVAADDTEGKP